MIIGATWTAVDCRRTVSVTRESATTVTVTLSGRNPMRLATRICRPSGTPGRRNAPVVVDTSTPETPATDTVAPTMPTFTESLTTPVIVPERPDSWAVASALVNRAREASRERAVFDMGNPRTAISTDRRKSADDYYYGGKRRG